VDKFLYDFLISMIRIPLEKIYMNLFKIIFNLIFFVFKIKVTLI